MDTIRAGADVLRVGFNHFAHDAAGLSFLCMPCLWQANETGA
jgi:hypothetical protein